MIVHSTAVTRQSSYSTQPVAPVTSERKQRRHKLKGSREKSGHRVPKSENTEKTREEPPQRPQAHSVHLTYKTYTACRCSHMLTASQTLLFVLSFICVEGASTPLCFTSTHCVINRVSGSTCVLDALLRDDGSVLCLSKIASICFCHCVGIHNTVIHPYHRRASVIGTA